MVEIQGVVFYWVSKGAFENTRGRVGFTGKGIPAKDVIAKVCTMHNISQTKNLLAMQDEKTHEPIDDGTLLGNYTSIKIIVTERKLKDLAAAEDGEQRSEKDSDGKKLKESIFGDAALTGTDGDGGVVSTKGKEEEERMRKMTVVAGRSLPLYLFAFAGEGQTCVLCNEKLTKASVKSPCCSITACTSCIEYAKNLCDDGVCPICAESSGSVARSESDDDDDEFLEKKKINRKRTRENFMDGGSSEDISDREGSSSSSSSVVVAGDENGTEKKRRLLY